MELFDNLKKYLSSISQIPPLEWLHFMTLLGSRSIGKDEYYFQQDEDFDEIGFVIKGLLYNYYTDEKGQQFVKYFIANNAVVSCYPALLRQMKTTFSCKTLEATHLITIKYSAFVKLYDRHPCWDRIGRKVAEKLYLEKDEREQYFLMADGKTRYEKFVQDRRELIDRIPQYIVASYLGLAPTSLSRIRGTTN